MPIKARVAGVTRTATALTIRVAGTNRRVVRARIMVAGSLRDLLASPTPLSVTVIPSLVSGFASGGASAPVTTESAQASPNGGASPFSYSWSIISGGPVTINTPANASTRFSATLSSSAVSGTALCTVTDALGATASSTVDFYLEHSSF